MIKTKEQLDCIVSNLSNEIVLNNITKTLNDNTTKEVVRDAVNEKLGEIELEQKRVTEDYNKYAKICNTNEHLKQIFLDEGVLGFYSKRLGFEVTPELMKKVLKKGTEIKKQNTKKQLQTGRSKFNGQRSKDEIDSIVGVNDYCASDFTSSEFESSRKPTRSLEHKVKFNVPNDTYSIFAISVSKDGSEMPNVFTLDDYFSRKTFINKEGGNEKLATLGIDVVSLNKFPSQSDGSKCYDRRKTDVLGVVNGNNLMKVVSQDNIYEDKTTKFMYMNCILESFLRALSNLGYDSDIKQILEGFYNDANKNGKPNWLFHKDNFKIVDAKLRLNNHHKIFSYNNSICFWVSRNYKFEKDSIFKLMRKILELISKRYSYSLNELLSCVTFYGCHDYTNQGDDTSNYFNTNANYFISSSNSVVSSAKPVVTADNTPEVAIDGFTKYTNKEIFEKMLETNTVSRIKFVYKGKQSILLPSKKAKIQSYFRNGDIVYSIMGALLKEGVSLEELISDNIYLLSHKCIHNEKSRTFYHLELDNGLYYYNNGYIGVKQVVPALDALLSKGLGFKLEFEFVSKK